MKGAVANTDFDWYRFCSARPHLEEVNFWRSGATNFKALLPGEPFFLMLKMLALEAKRAKKRKTKIRFRLNTKATVKVTFKRRTIGRKVGGKCRKLKSSTVPKRRCVRYVGAGRLLKKNRKAGRNLIRFNGKVGKKKLKPGRYKAIFIAKNEVGKSKRVKPALKVKRR